MTTQHLDCQSIEAMEKYMTDHHLTDATVYAVLDYDVEIHPRNYGKGYERVFDADEIDLAIVDNTMPTLLTEDEVVANAALSGKHSERYQGGNIWYQRGTAYYACHLVWDADNEWFSIEDTDYRLAPLWEL